MKEKLQALIDRGYKVQIRSRWTDKAWDVWIYRTDKNIIKKDRPAFSWNADLDIAIDNAIKNMEVVKR